MLANHWPILIYVPTVLVLLATLSLITGIIDRRDERRGRDS